MTRPKLMAAIAATLAVAVAVPFLWRLAGSPKPRTRVINLKARKYGYTPPRIIVNKGDTLIIRATSLDVTHGFLLEAYGIDAVIKQQGLMFLKYAWKDDHGKVHTDWDKVRQIKFKADKRGKFTFRCTQTCGSLHPFMTGELIVRDNLPYHLAVSLSIGMALALLLWFGFGPAAPRQRRHINLFDKLPWLKKAFKARSFQFIVILPNLVFFYLFILSAFWGSPVGNRNIAIIFVWILWWTLLKAVMLPFGGRVWCMMCPLPAPGEWLSRMRITTVRYFKEPFKRLHHRFLGLNRDWPRRLNNIWLQNILFLVLISFGIILITRPVATAVLFLIILAATLVLSLIFRGRSFCRFVCPVGGFLGTYSMAACSELRAIDPEVCKKHKEKECLLGGERGWACPWGQYPGKMTRNNYCGLCTECVKSCPKDNIGLFIRPFGSDLGLRGMDEVFNVLIMVAVAFVFSVTMLGPWNVIKQAANVTETHHLLPFLIYVGAVLALTLVVFPGLFMTAVKAGQKLAGKPLPWREMAKPLAYVFIPVGIFTWIAFSLPQVMINYSYILAVLSDPLGLGWNLLGTASVPYRPFWPESIPYIQGTLLLAGLYFGLSRGRASLVGVFEDQRTRTRAMIPITILTLLVINVFLRLYMG